MKDLERDYYQMQDAEENLTESLAQTLLDNKLNRAPVFIPSLVIEFESFWSNLLHKPGVLECGSLLLLWYHRCSL